MIPAAEAAVQRMLTKSFVDADAETVILQALSKVGNGAGGFRESRVPRAPQTMRLIPLGSGQERTLTDGSVVSAQYALLGYYGSAMERLDEFTLAGKNYRIVFVNENREYETKGEAILVG